VIPQIAGTSNIATEEFAGSSRVLVLGPSLGTNATIWNRPGKFFREEIDQLAWDLPGHGKSPAATEGFSIDELADGVLQLVDALAVDQFAYAGTSISGAVGLSLALRYPDRVKAAAIVCSAPKFGTPQAWLDRAEQVRKQGTGSLIAATPGRWFTQKFIAKEPEVVGEMLNMLLAADDASYAYACEALAGYDLTERLGEIEPPVLVISGEQDPVATPAQAKAMADAITNNTYIEVFGVSHQAGTEAPEVVAKHINHFVRMYR